MIVKRVTRVRLSRTTEPTPGDFTSYPVTEMWRVEWTKVSDAGKETHLRQSLYTEASARRLAGNLVEGRRDDLSVEDVYSERP